MTLAADGPITYTARWLAPLVGPTLAGGCIVVRKGTIAAVGPRRVAEGPIVDLGEAVVAPGFVNAHTHLEFSDCERPIGRAGQPFAEWIRDVIACRRWPEFDARRAVARGLREAASTGTVALGDIATTAPFDRFIAPLDAGSAPDNVSTPHVTAFVELLGFSAERAERQRDHLDEFLRLSDRPNVRRGVSPHAPYTVRPELFAAAVARAAEFDVPLAFHLAESRDELQLLAEGRGPLADLLGEVGAWDPTAIARGTRPLDYLRTLAAAPRSLVVHGNYLADDEIAFLAERRERMSLVYCPRTHEYFGHDPYSLEKMLQAGAACAVATDGRSSNPDLNMHAELQAAARKHPRVSPEQIFRLGTSDAARALGIDSRFGTLAPGRSAAFNVFRLQEPCADPYQAMLAPSTIVEPLMR